MSSPLHPERAALRSRMEATDKHVATLRQSAARLKRLAQEVEDSELARSIWHEAEGIAASALMIEVFAGGCLVEVKAA